ncbi:hypothetical protein KNE206_57630 [Kitasatospora sp. NE20-6]|uniref:hypothetical protein n=1 Tax=Kitasatospora sp. NE20-6 TaxID=2859066 RepID=UPI0034DCA682
MRTKTTIRALLSALLGAVLLLAGAEVSDALTPRQPVPAVGTAVPAERSDTGKDLPTGLSQRHGPHAAARHLPGTSAALRPARPDHTAATPARPACAPPAGPSGATPYPSRPTGGTTASVFQVFRC